MDLKKYLHTPAHYFEGHQVFMVTSGTYKRKPFLKTHSSKEFLLEAIHKRFQEKGWEVIAYCVLDNHYHVLVRSPESAEDFPTIMQTVHKFSALELNRSDGVKGRKVWWNYWDTCITYERSYYARLNYIHFNPVKHGYTDNPADYRFSSYGLYYEDDKDEFRKGVKEYPFDRVKIIDDF